MAAVRKSTGKRKTQADETRSISLRSFDTKRRLVVGSSVLDEDEGKESSDWRHENIGRLLFFAFAAFESRMIAGYQVAGFDDVRQVHLNALRHVDTREGSRIVELAASAGVTKGAMGQMLDDCIRLDLVSVRTDPRDSRAKLVRLTARGTKFMIATRRSVAAIEREFASILGDGKYEDLREGLRKIRKNVSAASKAS